MRVILPTNQLSGHAGAVHSVVVETDDAVEVQDWLIQSVLPASSLRYSSTRQRTGLGRDRSAVWPSSSAPS